ncbi:MAG: hypothetical protein RQ952_07740 [Thermoproteota archaeon]|jgi:hypothetical protein|nr:hypothetical protein [Thermoproteota archaeon]
MLKSVIIPSFSVLYEFFLLSIICAKAYIAMKSYKEFLGVLVGDIIFVKDILKLNLYILARFSFCNVAMFELFVEILKMACG